MSRTRNYRDLIAWQKAMGLARAIYASTEQFPCSETFGLRMRRSAVNTASYIADGHGKSTDSENRKQLGNARGARNELQTQVELAESLRFFPSGAAEELLDLATEVAKLLNGLIGCSESLIALTC